MNPKFSQHSLDLLKTCDERLIVLAEEVLDIGMDFKVIYGHRTPEEQQALFERGLSKKQAGRSKHNSLPSLAVDVAPYPVDWKNLKRFYHLAGLWRAKSLELEIPLRWGGDWDGDFDLDDQSFFDLGHFEIRG